MKKLPRVPYNPEYYPGYAYKKIDILLSKDSNSGEGVWCLLSPEDQKNYDDDVSGVISCAILCNDSKFYPTLLAGQVVPIKFNGDTRATIPTEWLNEKSWEILDNT
jgi:hypothetical protein